MPYETLVVETRGSAAIIRFNRPKVMNALNDKVGQELADALAMVEAEDDLAAAILTGNDKVFATGLEFDLNKEQNFARIHSIPFPASHWDAIEQCRKPVIAAVAGYAVGEGLELALMCDIILAVEGSKFGIPNLAYASLPAFGGCQRLTRIVGRAKAMDMILTGRMMDTTEAERAGLISRVVPDQDSLLDEAMKISDKLGDLSRPVLFMAKEAVNFAQDPGLAGGLRLERALFQASLTSEDWAEGQAAKAEKRSPSYRHR